MRILLCSFLCPFPYSGGGGTWSYVQQLKQGLENEGHEVTLFSRRQNPDGYHVIGEERFIEKKK